MSNAPSSFIQLLLVPALFFAGVKASLLLSVPPDGMVMLWLPNGLLLAALLRCGLRRYGYFSAIVLLTEIAADHPTFTATQATLFGLINLLEVTAAYLLLRRWSFNPGFEAPSDIMKFLVAGPMVGAFLSSCLGAGVFKTMRGADTAYLELVRVWWLSDGTGLLIVTPLVLGLWPASRPRIDERVALRWFDAVAAMIAAGVVTLFMLSQKGFLDGTHIRPVLLFPLVVYAAARLTPQATSIVVAAAAAVVLRVVTNGQEPFGELPVSETVLQAQQLVLLMSVTSLALAALLSQLRARTRELETRVRERTAELQSANEALQRLTFTDPLTGLLNRRALFQLLGNEMARGLRHRRGLGVIMIDVDRFKDVNDRHGHVVGDIVLRHVAAVATSTIRETDSLARFGGEELVVVVPETSAAQAAWLAERIRAALESSPVTVDGGAELRVTASFGVAVLQPDDREPEQLIDRADRALYAAKRGGRNRIVMEERSVAVNASK